MILLNSTSDLIQVITGSASSVNCHATWVDGASGTYTPGRENTPTITTAATTTVVPSPASSTARALEHLSVRNTGSAQTVTVQHTDGTNVEVFHSLTLNAGYVLVYNSGSGWSLYDASGNLQQAFGTGRFLKETILTSTSSTSFTTSSATNTIRIRMVGGGAGGGGCTSVASAASAAGGGGSGAYLEKTVSVQPSTAYTYQCGAQGNGSSGAAGGNGSSTTFTVGATTYTAPGGTGGPQAVSTTTVPSVFAGGAGAAVATNGDVNGGGAPGDIGIVLAVTPTGVSGIGGSCIFGGGGKAATSAGAGNAATGFGGGGGGALTGSSSARAGGNGTPGVIIVEEFS